MLRLRNVAVAFVVSAGCSTPPAAPAEEAAPADDAPHSAPSSSGDLPFPAGYDLGAECDQSRSGVRDGQSLVVRDPAVLSRFALRRVVTQILKSAGHADADPLAFVQRIFDTENAASGAAFTDGVHCDDAKNGAFVNAAAVDCPRAEGALARSTGLLTAGDPDSFVPVALIHRFDLIGTSLRTCGEYRILYAKTSGATDPSNRVFLIFEGALENPTRTLAACRPVAEKLARWDYGADADEIESFYFAGGGDGFGPVVRAESYGLKSGTCNYAGECGQIRVAQGMQEPFAFRELRLVDDSSPFQLQPVTVKSSPVPALFTAASDAGDSLRSAFLNDVDHLAKGYLPAIATSLDDRHNAGESALSGTASPDFPSHLGDTETGVAFLAQLKTRLGQVEHPPYCGADPITPEALVRRSAALSCAGCHAPERFLGADRSVGCGIMWPKSLGQTHIDEHGNISDALRDEYLPHRADVLLTYLRACDSAAVLKNLVPNAGGWSK